MYSNLVMHNEQCHIANKILLVSYTHYSTLPQILEYYGFEGITQKNVKTDTQTTLGM